MKSHVIFTTMIVSVCIGILVNASCVFTQPKTLTILHTNDLHASFLPHEAFWVKADPKPMVGGFQELWWMMDSIKKARGVVLVLDGGDVMTGSPISEFDYQGSAGGALFEMMNMIGYDAWTIGNHDLDISQENLRQHTTLVKFPTVTANLIDTLGRHPLNNKEYVILDKSGVKVGIIGLITPELFHVTNTQNLVGLKLLPELELTQKIIDKIKDSVDLIVGLTHCGVDADSVLAVKTNGLDVIIGGHSHTRLKIPKVVNDVIICQTGSNCENLGELNLTIEHRHVTAQEGKLHSLWVQHDDPRNELSKFIKEFKEKIDKEYGEVLGTLASDWKRAGKGESNLGNFMVDAMREGANADLAIANSSSLRKDLSAGPIRKLDLFEIMPFRNVLCTFKISGKEVKAFAQRYAKDLANGSASVQVSGLACKWKRGDTITIEQLSVDGKEVDENKTYTCATSDFAVNQADKYLGIVPMDVTYTDTTVFSALVAKVIRDKAIDSKVENRFQELH